MEEPQPVYEGEGQRVSFGCLAHDKPQSSILSLFQICVVEFSNFLLFAKKSHLSTQYWPVIMAWCLPNMQKYIFCNLIKIIYFYKLVKLHNLAINIISG